MTVTCVVQARTGSTRLPGKVLAEVAGRPMLGFLLDRLARLRVDDLVVATSDLERDDPVAAVAAERHVDVVRGSEGDVLDRFLTALDAHPADVVVRITADCPLSDPDLISAAIDLRAQTGADYVSNSLLRTFPVGLDVEVVTATALRQAAAEATDAPEREHVMPFVYRRPERYRLVALRCPDLLGDERWTVDTPADLERVRDIVARVPDPVTAGWRDVLAVFGRHADPEPGEVVMRPALEDDAGVALGPSLALTTPPRIDPLDAGSRTWVMTVDGNVVAWLRLSVRAGVGELDGASRPEWSPAVRERFRRALRTDYQVREWVTGEPELPGSAGRASPPAASAP